MDFYSNNYNTSEQNMIGFRPWGKGLLIHGSKEWHQRHTDLIGHRVPKLEIEVEESIEKLKNISIPIGGKSDTYSNEQKILTATVYACTANMVTAADYAEVPYKVALGWKKSSWWDQVLSEIKQTKLEEFDAKATQIIDKLLFNIYEGLKKDNTVRDLAYVLSIIYDKRALARGDPTVRKEVVNHSKILKDLAKEFEKVTKPEENYIEAERVDNEEVID